MIQSRIFVTINDGKVSAAFPYLNFRKMLKRRKIENYTRGAYLRLNISTKFIQKILNDTI